MLAFSATGSPSPSNVAMILGSVRLSAYDDAGDSHGMEDGGRAMAWRSFSSRTAAWLAETGRGSRGSVTSIIVKAPGSKFVGP